MTLTQGHLNIKIKIMVFSEITWFGNYCSLIMRPETLQMQTTYEVNKGVKVCEYSRSRSFHDDLILQDQASGERSQDQWSSGNETWREASMDRILISLKKENGPWASSAPALGLNTIIFKHVYWYMQQTQVSVYRTIGPLVIYFQV